MKKNNGEFTKFENTVKGLLQVPHAEIKAKLEQEKAEKERKKSKKSSASHEANDRA
jgi:hypothetical protein